MRNKIRFIEVEGSPYEKGRSAGLQFKKSLAGKTLKYEKLIEDSRYFHRMKMIKEKTAAVFPDYVQEVYGRADGAGINRDVYFLMMCAELLGEGTGCSTIIYRREDGTFLLGHNEDDEFTIENSCITKCNTCHGWFITSDYHTMPFGNGFSWNSHGIAKVINYCHSNDVNALGIPRYFLQRHISEAVSIDDFLERCDQKDRGSGFHAIVIDRKANKAVSVEMTAEEISVMEIKDRYAHTNHYIHSSIGGNGETHPHSSSSFRLRKITEMLNHAVEVNGGVVTREHVRKILSFRGSDFENSVLAISGDPYVTLGTFTVDTREPMSVGIHFHITDDGMNCKW